MAKQYSPRLKFQIAMEVLRDSKKPSQVAKAYGVHPNSIGKWTKTIRQSVKALNQGELAVLAGDDKDKYDDAWFVVLSAKPPAQ